MCSKAWAIGDRENAIFLAIVVLSSIYKLNWMIDEELSLNLCLVSTSIRYFTLLKKIPIISEKFDKKIPTYMTNNEKDRWKDRRSWSYDRDRDRRSFLKWRSGSGSRSQFLIKIGIGIAISILAIGLMLWRILTSHVCTFSWIQINPKEQK